MLSILLKSVGITLIGFGMIACGGGGGGDTTSLQTAGTASVASNDIMVAQSPNTAEPTQLPEVTAVVPSLDLNKPLTSTSVTEDVITTSIEGLAYTNVDTNNVKNIWNSNTFVNVGTNIRYVAPRCKSSADVNAICGRISNTGLTVDSPWDLMSTAGGDQNVPSDTIVWMLPGDYSHPDNDYAGPTADMTRINFTLSGEYNKPIHFRPLPGLYVGANKGVRINGGIEMNSSWVWIWEVEMTAIQPKVAQNDNAIVEYELMDWRPATSPLSPFEYYFDTSSYDELHALAPMRMEAFVVYSDNSKLVNVISHRTAQGSGVWGVAKDFEQHGSILYDNGWSDQDRVHGHGIYTQNGTKTKRIFSDNIIAGNMGNGMQIYASSEHPEMLNDFEIIGNVWFAQRLNSGNGIKISAETSTNIHFEDNFIAGYGVVYPYVATPEYTASPKPELFNRTCENNRMYETMSYGYDCGSMTNLKIKRTDSSTEYSVLRPNKYDPRRANLMVFNPEQKTTVAIDLANFAKTGDRIVIYNSLNMKEPLEYGIYNGENATITWPTHTKWKIADIPWTYFDTDFAKSQEGNLEKEFWAFVVFNMGQ